ncbi:MAG: Gfo/Idh/MocA family oxidoreductase [Candidatus Bathyarchaeia archaeon]
MKVGLIGCGGIANIHMGAYKRIKDVEVTAVCDLNLDRAKGLAKKFGVEKVFGDYMDMVEAEQLDLVDVCTPVSTHAKIVIDVSRDVPAVFVEKPMALSVQECDEIIEEIRRRGTKLCVGHNQLFLPTIQRAKALVDSGSFDLLSFKTVVKEDYEFLRAHGWLAPWAVAPEQKGVLWESCCHLAYLHLHFLPNIVEVYAVGNKVKYPVYDDFAVLLRTADSRFGIIELSWLSKETEISYELRDKTGRRLEIYRDFDYLIEKMEKPPYNVWYTFRNVLVDEGRVLKKWIKYGVRYLKNGKTLPIYILLNEFIESIKKDTQPPVTPEDGKQTIALLECIEKSLDSNKPMAMLQS